MTEHFEPTLIGDKERVKMAWFEHGTSRIYYEEAGTGDPILLLPGLTDRIEHHQVLRTALVAAGYRVIAADLPGSGRSEPQPRTYTASYYEDDARSFAALLEHLAVAQAHVIGFSDGGEDALLMAEMSADLVCSVVTWGAAGRFSDPSGQLRAAMDSVVDHPIPPMQPYSEYLIATYGKDNARAATQSFVRAITAIIDQRDGDVSLSKADSITCPVLLIAGEHDPFAPPALVEQLAARIRTAETLKADGAGHNIHDERLEWLVQTILDWLNQH